MPVAGDEVFFGSPGRSRRGRGPDHRASSRSDWGLGPRRRRDRQGFSALKAASTIGFAHAGVDLVPVSLVLAQGAEESGWGTSRFASEGNALFGRWTWSGKGIKPKEQREELGDYRIAAFDKPLASVEAYLLNINSNQAYAPLRAGRAEARRSGQALSGWELAKTLTSYSERGPDYVGSLHAIMRVNKLQPVDEAYLVGEEVWEIYPPGK